MINNNNNNVGASIINTFYDRGYGNKNVSKMIMSVKYDDNSKEIRIIEKPKFKYYLTKDNYKIKIPVKEIPANHTTVHVCEYDKLYVDIARNTGTIDIYNKLVANKKRSGFKKVIADNPNIHGSDINIEDFYRKIFKNKYETSIDADLLNIMYYDIENEVVGKVDPIKAAGRINAISIHCNNKIVVLVLTYPDIEDSLRIATDVEFRKSIEIEIFKREKKLTNIESVNILPFNSELKLLKKFFNIIHVNMFDYVVGWNSNDYDMPYILSRIQQLLGRGELLPSRKEKRFTIYHFDKKVNDIVIEPSLRNVVKSPILYKKSNGFKPINKDHYFKIPGHTVYLDQQYVFAEMTRNKQEVSYKLDHISQVYLDDVKDTFGDGVNVTNAWYKEHINFIKYNVHDTILCYRIEKLKSHLETLFLLSDISGTRPEKVMKKTTTLPNMVRIFYESVGYILSNNRHLFDSDTEDNVNTSSVASDIDDDFKTILKGGFVANPKRLDNVGVLLMDYFRSSKIFDNVSDADLSSQYPSNIVAFFIDVGNLIGSIEIVKKYKTHGVSDSLLRQNIIMKVDENDIVLNIGANFTEAIISGDYINLGNEYMGLPNISEICSVIDKVLLNEGLDGK